jgi:hypothetical protein
MEHEGLLSWLQDVSIGPYPDPYESSPYHPILLI